MKTTRLSFNQLNEELEVLQRGNLKAIKGGSDIQWGEDADGNVYWRDGDNGTWNRYVVQLSTVVINSASDYSLAPSYNYSDYLSGGGYEGGGGNNYTFYGGPGSNNIGTTTRGIYDTGFDPNYVNMFFGAGEVAIGIYTAVQTGGLASAASYYMIADGLARMGLSLNADGPSNLGGAIGSFYGPDGQKWGELTNDGITAVISGGAFDSAWGAWGAFSAGDYYLGSYFAAEGLSTTYNVADILYNHLVATP